MNIAREWWWAWLIPIPIFGILAAFGLWGWAIGVTITLVTLYCLFWLAQFAAVTQHENTKILFERFAYEITSRQILIKIDAKRGMPVQWDKIQSAQKKKNHFILRLSRVQFIYLPFSIFKSEHEIKFLETILKRKQLLPKPKTKA
ncbi:MAG: YcxB family protein [Bacteroidota bacterium]